MARVLGSRRRLLGVGWLEAGRPRRLACAPRAGVGVSPHSRWRDAQPPPLCGGSSPSRHVLGGRKSHRSVTRSGVGQSGAGFEGYNPSPGPEPPPDAAANAADAPAAAPARTTRSGAAVRRAQQLAPLRVVVGAVASSLRRPPSRGANGAAACGAVLVLLAPAQSCRRARGGVTLGRRSPAAAARSPSGASARRLALSACGRRRGRFSSEAIAVARRQRRCCLRCRAGAPGAGLVVPPHSWRRDAWPLRCRGGGSLSWRTLSRAITQVTRCPRHPQPPPPT